MLAAVEVGLAALVELLVVLLYLLAALVAVHDGHAQVEKDQIVEVADFEVGVNIITPSGNLQLTQHLILFDIVEHLLSVARLVYL